MRDALEKPAFTVTDPRLEEIVHAALADDQTELGAILMRAPKPFRRAAIQAINAVRGFAYHRKCLLDCLDDESIPKAELQKETDEALETFRSEITSIEVAEDYRTPAEIMKPFFERVEECRVEYQGWVDHAMERARASVHRKGLKFDHNAVRGPDGTVWWDGSGCLKFTTDGRRLDRDESHKVALKGQAHIDGWDTSTGQAEWAWRSEKPLPNEYENPDNDQWWSERPRESDFKHAMDSMKHALTDVMVCENILARKNEIVAWAIGQDTIHHRFAKCPEDLPTLMDFLGIVPEDAVRGGAISCALHSALDTLNGYEGIRGYCY